jgi:hypothetical protein
MKERWLWLNEEHSGPYSEGTILRMVAKGQADGDTLFWDDAEAQWRPLTHIRDDAHAEDLQEIKREGLRKVEFVAGRTENECPVCQALHGKIFPISEAPRIPPEGCTCDPWSLAKLIGHH